MNRKQLVTLTFAFLLLPSIVLAEEISITVKGMVCSFCAQGIKKTFSKNEHVKSVRVDLERKIVEIETKDDASISDEDIRRTINDAGYDVLAIQRGKK